MTSCQTKANPNSGIRQGAEGLFLYKQRQRGGEAVQIILVADGPDFTVAKISRETEGAQVLFNEGGIVVRRAE
jgi:hypothetical protein